MSTEKTSEGDCCCNSAQQLPNATPQGSNVKYFVMLSTLAVLWALAYAVIQPFANWLVFGLLGVEENVHLGLALEFFIYDSVKILLLLVALIYAIAWIRASLNVERVRDFLAGKRRSLGYFLGAVFGAITPFCSCSSIPLFLGFTMARIPVGITMAFLITSPLINEIAVVLLWGLLGWKFTLLYVFVGLVAGAIGGFVMDSLKAQRWLQPFIAQTLKNAPAYQPADTSGKPHRLSVHQRHVFAYEEMSTIFKRVWKWVFVGVGIGAVLHGFVPENWFATNLGAGQWWTVPASVFVGIPLYSNVTGIIPIMESLLVKGLPIGTTMAFCMSAVAASIPEVVMLRQIMTLKLQAAFIGYLWICFTLVGWLLNWVGPSII